MESAMNVGGNMKKTKTLNLLIVLLTMFALTSCAFIQKTNKRKQIVTTLYPEYDMINKIIGTKESESFCELTPLCEEKEKIIKHHNKVNKPQKSFLLDISIFSFLK